MERLKELVESAKRAARRIAVIPVQDAVMFCVACVGLAVGLIVQAFIIGYNKGKTIAWARTSR